MTAASVDLLLGTVERRDLDVIRETLGGGARRVWAVVWARMRQMEQVLAEHGLASPRILARRRRAEEQMPEAFGALAISLGSGLSLMQSMRYVGGHADEPVRTEFLRTASEMGCGIPASDALDGLVGRLRAPGLELVALALKVSRRTGAPLAGLLAEAARLASDRVELARRLDVKTSQARMSARLVAAMPVGMMGFLLLFSGDFRAGVATMTGALSIVVALALNLMAWVVIHRIMQVRL